MGVMESRRATGKEKDGCWEGEEGLLGRGTEKPEKGRVTKKRKRVAGYETGGVAGKGRRLMTRKRS